MHNPQAPILANLLGLCAEALPAAEDTLTAARLCLREKVVVDNRVSSKLVEQNNLARWSS